MGVERLLEIMRRLRDPQHGCPWDREQTWCTIAPHTIEEAYELEDAIHTGDPARVQDELGDLLFQVVCQARIAEEQGVFAFADVVDAICDKLERRHPHVFGTARVESAAQVSSAWEAQKARERAARGGGGALDGIAVGLPGLTRAAKLGKRAAGIGFDWPAAQGVLDKLREELTELESALASGNPAEAGAELGDLLFSAAQLARHLEIDPETCLRSANRKFEQRFAAMERSLAASSRDATDATAAELEVLWARAKRHEL
ncbi:MAG TPA: nucleoside triphosphate pyrophosphohydrolase [Burkholderiales bacterium]|nr:nucleoside triphosphate pyrophosphohydrolase [Burkholderiales bacterium]